MMQSWLAFENPEEKAVSVTCGDGHNFVKRRVDSSRDTVYGHLSVLLNKLTFDLRARVVGTFLWPLNRSTSGMMFSYC